MTAQLNLRAILATTLSKVYEAANLSMSISFRSLTRKTLSEVDAPNQKETLKQRLDALLDQYQENDSDLDIVMEIAVIYELLGSASNAFYFYNWATDLADRDETLNAKVSHLAPMLAA